MVSSAYSQPLSYADRAKKAHNVSTKPVAQQLPFTLSATSHPSNSADLTMPHSLPDHKSPVDPNGDSPTTPTTSPLKPVNVWSLRKEQMAQALASRSPIRSYPLSSLNQSNSLLQSTPPIRAPPAPKRPTTTLTITNHQSPMASLPLLYHSPTPTSTPVQARIQCGSARRTRKKKTTLL